MSIIKNYFDVNSDIFEYVEINGEKIGIKKYLSCDEVTKFIEYVVSACYGDDGKYSPETMDIVTEYYKLAFYTNIDLSDEDVVSVYNYCMSSGISEQIDSVINKYQYNNIMCLIDKRISHINATPMIDLCYKLNNASNVIYDMVSKLSDIVDKIDINDIEKILGSYNKDYISSESK